ncbi:MAG: hypothetical protein IPO80_04220 [Propionibacteriaceae bacterium]|nr:hypothetical protein [Propionibacteriaceae bacterium]
MTPGSTARLRRALVLALATVFLGAGLAAAPVPARADTPALSVQLTSLTMSGKKPTDRLTLRGTVTNTGNVRVFGVHAMIWLSRDPIQDLPTLRTVSSATFWGSRLFTEPGSYLTITKSAVPLEPGASAPIELTPTLASLGFTTAGAAYAIGTEVRASASPATSYTMVAQARSFIAMPGKQPVDVTPIVVLSAPPTKLSAGLFRSDDLVKELSGRLDDLLDAAAQDGLNYLIDPALLDEVTDMADGYQIRDRDTVTPGSGQAVAQAWFARFSKLPSGRGSRSLFGNPDVVGAAAAADTEVLPRAFTATAGVTDLDDLPLLVLPGGAQLTSAAYAALAATGATGVIAANAAAAGAWQAGPGGLPVVAAASGMDARNGESAFSHQRFLEAETVIAGAAGQVRLLFDAADLAVNVAATPSWTRPRNLNEVIAATPKGRPASFVETVTSHLSSEQFEAVAALERGFASYGQLVPESTLTEQAAAGLSRGASSNWIGDDKGQARFVRALGDLVGPPAIARGVTLDASARFVMSARRNEFPLTVTNNLSETIRVKVRVVPDNALRLTIPDSDVINVGPGQSQTVNVRPEAQSNGLVPARAYVATEQGNRVTPDTRVTIEVTELGMIGWVIVVASGVVLVAATALRVRQVRRRSAGTPVSTSADQPEGEHDD